MNRATAKFFKLKRYTPDDPCYRGHKERFTSTGACCDCTVINRTNYRATEHGKTKTKAYNSQYMADNQRVIQLRRYGLTEQDFAAMLATQDNKCAICQNVLGEGRDRHVDHCHDTNVVRGILCRSCNVGLGHFKHDARILGAAITYVGRNN